MVIKQLHMLLSEWSQAGFSSPEWSDTLMWSVLASFTPLRHPTLLSLPECFSAHKLKFLLAVPQAEFSAPCSCMACANLLGPPLQPEALLTSYLTLLTLLSAWISVPSSLKSCLPKEFSYLPGPEGNSLSRAQEWNQNPQDFCFIFALCQRSPAALCAQT